MSRRDSFDATLVTAVVLYLVSVWLHFPYGGGHIYSDIVSVFQTRECLPSCVSPVPIPYVQSFIEYPVGTAFFIYAMGYLAGLLPGNLVNDYYLLSCVFLLIPTLLMIRELRIIALLRGTKQTRLLWFFIVTPTFLFTLLVNWYVIGAFFSILAIRVYLQGKNRTSGVLMGVSAVFNLVSAAPALGLLLSQKKLRDGVVFCACTLATFALANAPVYLLNPANWMKFWSYQYGWVIEDSWMLLFVSNESMLRHLIPPILFFGLACTLVVLRFRLKEVDPVKLALLSMFAFIFSTYVYTPQMNVLILPFFVLIPISSYPEFLVFDVLNAYVILGFSTGLPMFLALFGLNYNVSPWGPLSPVQLAGIIRSFWLGKFLIYDGVLAEWKAQRLRLLATRPSPSPKLGRGPDPLGQA